MRITEPAAGADFLLEDSEMGHLVRELDWAATPLGPVEGWSASLRMMVRFVLANRFPMLLWWGPQYIQVYNDAYRPILGTKHPQFLGRPVVECWAEVWDILKPLVDTPFLGGPATWMEDLEVELLRHGFTEESHFTIAYSPVPDESAPRGIGGVLATVHEITEKVIGERRVGILSELGARVAEAKTGEDACAMATRILSRHWKDLPFALVYLLTSDGSNVRQVGATSGELIPAGPTEIDLTAFDRKDAEASLPGVGALIAQALRTETTQVGELNAHMGVTAIATGGQPKPETLVVVPIMSLVANRPAGAVVVGISPRIRLDRLYSSFLELVGSQIATAVANARAYDEERRRAEALAEIDRAKTAFFSNVSHEFRTPLTLMLGPVQDVLTSPTTSGPARVQLELAHRNSLRLLKLVNSLLEFSRIEAGRVQASYVPTDLAALTADLASTFTTALELAGLKLEVDLQALPEPVYVDRDMWEKIVLNLLSNAFKYTLQGGIAVSLEPLDEAALLTVRDTGIGIPAAALPRLFERFFRVEGAEGRTHEGSGIGLALVHELVKLHGGNVTVESQIGAGTVFKVHVPLGSAHLPQERIGSAQSLQGPVVSARMYVEEALRWLPESRAPAADAPAAFAMKMTRVPTPRDAHPRSAVYGARVIVADDNSDMRAYVRELLESRYQVETVADGKEALESARRAPPDLIVSDVMMPRMDGFALLQALRADPQLRDIPTILLSARAGEEAVIEGLDAMADDYLVKPFSARELIARVGAQLQLARLRREASEREHTRLKTADRQKNEFLAMLAHELRNPLAPIRNASEILARTLPTASSEQALVAMVKRQVSQLTRLVDDLLDVSRITQGRVELQCQPLELGTVIHQALETAEPLFQARRHEVSTITHARHLYVDGDMTRLVQSVVNILTNAAKYTDEGGRICIDTRADGVEAVVTITDTGAGISAELLPRVFDLFVQGERTLDRSLGGLGIGLSVARRLIEMHGGRLSAASPGMGQGSTFEIRLPRLEHSPELSGRHHGLKGTAQRILIVDDNADAANSLAQVLTLDGHVTESVYSARAALASAVSFRPDVVLIDLGLPEMDGYEVARRMRALPDLGALRVVALTGYGQSEDIRRSREVGIDAHLTKPVDFMALDAVLHGR